MSNRYNKQLLSLVSILRICLEIARDIVIKEGNNELQAAKKHIVSTFLLLENASKLQP